MQDLIPEDFTSSTTYPEMRDAGVWLKKELRNRLDDVGKCCQGSLLLA